jgi:hypothetical protein
MTRKIVVFRPPGRQSGMALLLALWLLVLGTLIGCTWYMECLYASRLSGNRCSRQVALDMAHTGLALTIAYFTAIMEANREWPLNRIFAGADGILGPCRPSLASNQNPVDPSMAWITPLSRLTNACGDDGTVDNIGANGISVFRRHGVMEYCLSGSGSEGVRIGHIWVKISDNPEPDNDPAVDQDSLMILRVIAAAANTTDVHENEESVRNAIVAMEAWLQRETDGTIIVLSSREVTL